MFNIKDCTLGIDLSVPGGGSFAVTSYEALDDVLLDQAGMKVTSAAKYYFKGNPVPTQMLRAYWQDASEGVLSLEDSPDQPVSSPCAATNRLNLLTWTALQNNAQKTGTGYVSIEAEDSDGDKIIRIGLAVQACEPPPPPPPSRGDRADHASPPSPGS
jgi:hypothetical protein